MSARLSELIEKLYAGDPEASLATMRDALTEIDRRLTALEGRGACCECPDLSRSPNAALWTSPHPMAAMVAEHLFAQAGPIGAPEVHVRPLPIRKGIPGRTLPEAMRWHPWGVGLWWRALHGRTLPDVRR